ncbi:hypothetical protein PoB_007260300 [Plakobranchus ocellatus]|uniref:Uncharacterized protein n=1 Tax=Plakobranchus ocellatus TaxID=259542 RepID=A0AAV4DP40_9GAST|nr:hypothetical protein PoB_007260300 [Plakobranchus ocellatus]
MKARVKCDVNLCRLLPTASQGNRGQQTSPLRTEARPVGLKWLGSYLSSLETVEAQVPTCLDLNLVALRIRLSFCHTRGHETLDLLARSL